MNTERSLFVFTQCPADRRALKNALAGQDAGAHFFADAAEFKSALALAAPAAVIVYPDPAAQDAGGEDGLALTTHVRRAAPSAHILVAVGQGGLADCVAFMRAGADNFVIKPAPAAAVRKALSDSPMVPRPARASAPETSHEPGRDFGRFIGRSAPMLEVYGTIRSAARSKASVFITGESGVGKELAAESLHQHSDRASGPFVAINCSAIPKDLLESELFGRVKGAFTGALADSPGAAGMADGGTLFLDELGEMDLQLQAKLLRFLQTETYQRVGEPEPRKADIRFVAATNRDPLAAVREGRLREDLYYRLMVVSVPLPPLRERGGDAILLAERFLAQFAAEESKSFTGFAPEAERYIASHPWPGNVRQLQNAVRAAVVLHDGPRVELSMIKDAGAAPLASPGDAPVAAAALPAGPLWRIEREAIESAIRACGGNIQEAARLLEISPSTIYRKRESWVGLCAA